MNCMDKNENGARKPAHYLSEFLKKYYHLLTEHQRLKLEDANLVLEELEQRFDRRLP